MPALSAEEAADRQELHELLLGYRRTQLVYAAARLGLPDVLASGPMTAAEAAAEVERRLGEPVNPRALHRVMRGLAVLRVLTEADGSRFAVGPLGRHLRTDAPGELRLAALEFAEVYYPAWGALLHTIRTGEPAFPHVFEMTPWQFRAERPELSHAFNRRMAELTLRSVEAVLAAYDLSSVRTLVDIGGGDGTLVVAMLGAYADMRGVLMEVPHVARAASARLEAAGVAHRCQVVTGDFFERVPEGGDAYLLKTIVHDWDDERAAAILRTCRRAMSPGSRLLLLERVLGPRAADQPEAIDADLTMLVQLGGRERTGAEFEELLGTAGLRLTRIVPTASPLSVIEAIPASG